MHRNLQKFFVIVGSPFSGKSRTIQELFRRTNFFPFKQPIRVAWEKKERFIVINSSDTNFRAIDHLHKIKSVVNSHISCQVSFVTPLSICFDESRRDIRDIMIYLNHLGMETHYLILASSWREKKIIEQQDIKMFNQFIGLGTSHMFDRLVTMSELRFRERRDEVIGIIRKILNKG
ncbi:hypothetical protein DVR12_10265 [Chitinophaga silvatica]|uniref:AAA domain-containing protein n=1 Tax=Chitinophaga silvatica TaxID=2282649 RepID=A0A3E1YBM0_9BACT|nr:hypothetical protein [Chitinophaga silvatica]RFS23391.1 hypothetical protein DVR12_10265 [Chitinophaga silvatica]